MENREFRKDVQEIWLDKFAESSKAQPFIQPKIATTSDMIRLTAKFTCGCLILMASAIAVVAVLA